MKNVIQIATMSLIVSVVFVALCYMFPCLTVPLTELDYECRKDRELSYTDELIRDRLKAKSDIARRVFLKEIVESEAVSMFMELNSRDPKIYSDSWMRLNPGNTIEERTAVEVMRFVEQAELNEKRMKHE